MGTIMNPFSSTIACLALTVGVIGAFTGTASASADDAEAMADSITVCRDAYGQNCVPGVPTTVSDALKQVRFDMQDSISSIQNPTPTTICFYEHNNYGGRAIAVPGYTNVNHLGGVFVGGSTMNDKISSWMPLGGRPGNPPGSCT
ncbi:peptidase inhibitor family I36 protein [Streptomyces olivaceus]|uniref:peptidase inhibitor family I36 protein n=1 Tax=Streptomyces olivaceus TaxID=47716 RepID=UPI001CCE63EE|nr:peptidase inhibitor family I36 protein [Streptomyces olivaceus]MBZ6254096.1 peptidase inhibitor family I36 protein [Streptomyces olivaceus]